MSVGGDGGWRACVEGAWAGVEAERWAWRLARHLGVPVLFLPSYDGHLPWDHGDGRHARWGGVFVFRSGGGCCCRCWLLPGSLLLFHIAGAAVLVGFFVRVPFTVVGESPKLGSARAFEGLRARRLAAGLLFARAHLAVACGDDFLLGLGGEFSLAELLGHLLEGQAVHVVQVEQLVSTLMDDSRAPRTDALLSRAGPARRRAWQRRGCW